MLNSSDRHFMNSWRDQREGPRWKYYLTYIVAWSAVIFLCTFFLLKLVMDDRSMGGWGSFYIVVPFSIVAAIAVTHLVYTINEKKFKRIIEREGKSN